MKENCQKKNTYVPVFLSLVNNFLHCHRNDSRASCADHLMRHCHIFVRANSSREFVNSAGKNETNKANENLQDNKEKI
jgi:hypothetical protein